MFLRFFTRIMTVLTVFVVGLSNSSATEPTPWQMGLQAAGSPSAERLQEFHTLLTIICAGIVIFVSILLVIVMVKYNRKANPVPSKNAHNTLLEVVWTAVPVLLLVAITIPSFRILYYLDRVEEADMTIKIVGHQWYWSYEYPDHEDLTFDSLLVTEDELEEGQPRLLTVDNALVVPAGKNIRLIMTSDDVIHSWAVPSLGVKLDTVPGRINETWVSVNEPGLYYGQCSELCGVNHGFMPITVRAVSEDEFAVWLNGAKEEFADGSSPEQVTPSSIKLAQIVAE